MSIKDALERKVAGEAVRYGAKKVDTPEEARAVVGGALGVDMDAPIPQPPPPATPAQAWAHSLIAGAIGSFVVSISNMLSSPEGAALIFTSAGLKQLAATGLAGALVAVAGLLKQSPLPPMGSKSDAN